MKKFFVISILLISFTVGAFAQSAEEVVARHVAAIGGEAKLKAVNSVKVTGVFKIPAVGVEFNVTVIRTRAGKSKTTIYEPNSDQEIIQSVDGDVVWTVDPFNGVFEPTVVDGDRAAQMKRGANMDGFFFNREANGIKLDYVAEVEEEGKKLDHIKVTFNNGDITEVYFDKETGLISKSVTTREAQGMEFEMTTLNKDYRDVEGILYSFASEQLVMDQQRVMEISNVEVNVEVDDTIFVMPVKEK